MNSKSNKTVLKAESIERAQADSCSRTSANSLPGTRSKEEKIKTRDRSKESINSGFKRSIDSQCNSCNPSKHLSFTSNVNSAQSQTSNENRYGNTTLTRQNSQPELVRFRDLSLNYPTRYFPSTYYYANSPQFNSVNLSSSYGDPSYNPNNRYHMRRSNTLNSTNKTQAIERDKQVAWNLRSWQRTPFGKKSGHQKYSPSTCYFKVMSYNVLAQELLTEHSYLYRNHHPRALLWEERWNNLLGEFKQHDADVLCLQEVQTSHLDIYFSELKKLGYDGIFKRRTGIRTDGCAIYYKRAVFTLVEHTTVEFNQSDVSVLNRDNVAIVAKLSPHQAPESEFIVATTHLLYNPRREDVRLAQTQVFLSEIDRMSFVKTSSNKHTHLPIIVTGDFNLTPTSAVYELLTQGVLQYEHLTNRALARGNTTANVTGKSLLPSSLRITDECQHADLLEQRKENSALNREDELKLVQLQHSERETNNKCSMKFNKSMFSSGTLSHHLALKSAYEHRHGAAVEATTFQDKWVTVDYIFYSGTRDNNNLIQEHKLKLLSRYAVPTAQQLEGITIPNFAFGSDHLSLVVKFQLDP